MVTGLFDKFEAHREKIVAGLCIFGFLAGLIFCTQAGLYYLDIVDHWMNGYGLAAVGLMECIVVGWVLGSKRLRKMFRSEHPEFEQGPPLCGPYQLKNYVNEVSDFKVGWWWDLCIMVITPGILAGSLVLSFISDVTERYEGYTNTWLILCGWCVAVGVVLLGVMFMLLKGRGDDFEEEGEE